MGADKLTFLDEETPEVEEQQEPETVEAEPETEGTGEEPEPEQQEPEVAEPPAAKEPEESRSIPISALLDEREKRQRLERELAELRKQAKPQQVPDVIEDPDGYRNHVQSQVQGEIHRVKMEQSRFFAERDFGKDAVAEVVEYFNAHPRDSWQFMEKPSPFHAAVEYVKRQKLLAEIGDDPDAWKQRQLDELRQQAAAQATPASPKAPPPSMANAPNAGKPPIKPGSAFEGLFGD